MPASRRVLSSRPTQRATQQEEDTSVEQFLRVLDEHVRVCERAQKYHEAAAARARLQELRSHEDTRRRNALGNRQRSERLDVEESRLLELDKFNMLWQKRIAEYDFKAGELEQAMKSRHFEERDELDRRTTATAPPNFSRDLLNLRKIQQTLAKQKEYVEADRIKSKADALEGVELERHRIRQQGKTQALQDRLLFKQEQELCALLARIKLGRTENIRQQEQELHRLTLRHKNSNESLQRQHTRENMRNKVDIRNTLRLSSSKGATQR